MEKNHVFILEKNAFKKIKILSEEKFSIIISGKNENEDYYINEEKKYFNYLKLKTLQIQFLKKLENLDMSKDDDKNKDINLNNNINIINNIDEKK